MKLKQINFYVLTEAPLSDELVKRLSSYKISPVSFKSYAELIVHHERSSNDLLVLDLLANPKFKLSLDLKYFLEVAKNYEAVQVLEWSKNNGKPFLEIDKNYKIVNEKEWNINDSIDGLERTPLYFFKKSDLKLFINNKGIIQSNKLSSLPISFPKEGLNFSNKPPALFLDRDGIINEDQGYVFRHEDIRYKEEVFSIIKLFNKRCWPVFIVTNQSGIAQGKYTEADVVKLHKAMLEDFKERGVSIEKIVYSPFHFAKGLGDYKKKSFTRKPFSGMALEILNEYAVDINKSFMIGDKVTDQIFIPGLQALLLKGNYSLEGAHSPIFNSLLEIEKYISKRL